MNEKRRRPRKLRKGKIETSAFAAVAETRKRLVSEHLKLAAQVEALESFIVSVPAEIALRQRRYREMLPPPDDRFAGVPGLFSRGGRRRAPRRRVQQARATNFRTASLVLGLMLVVGALIAFIVYLLV